MSVLKEIEPNSNARISAASLLFVWMVVVAIVVVLSIVSPGSLNLSSKLNLSNTKTLFIVIILIVGIPASLIFGYISGLLNAIVFNYVADKIGGVGFDFSENTTIDSIGVISYSKIQAAIYFVYGFINLLITSVFTLIVSPIGAIITFVLGIIGTVVGAIFSFIIGAILASIYNFAANMIGGIQVELSDNMEILQRIDPTSYGKISGFMFQLLGIAIGLFIMSASARGFNIGLVIILLFGIVGFGAGFLGGMFYNFIASKVGGLKIKIEGTEGPKGRPTEPNLDIVTPYSGDLPTSQ